jgi:hypothetical protein
VIEHLIRCTALAAANGQQFFHVGDVEVRHTPTDDLAIASQTLERTNGFGERNPPAPVEQIQIEPIGIKTLQTSLACGDRTLGAGVVRIHFADHEHTIPLTGDCGCDNFLRAPVTVHFSGVDERHAEIDAET